MTASMLLLLVLSIVPCITCTNPLTTLNATQIIEYNGYPAEYHEIMTEDGYRLGMQRIPRGINDASRYSTKDGTPKPAVLLNHGLLGCSTNWITNMPNESLAYILADAGYDVWLGNMRGSTYATLKGKYDPKKHDYWKFSFDEMAQFDLPAQIDHVLKVTGNSQLHYIGHSQGTMIGFIHFSQNATTAAKVKSFYALGPVTTVTYIQSAIRLLAQFTYPIDYFFEVFGWNDFLPSDDWLHQVENSICNNVPAATNVCDNLIFMLLGTETTNMNKTRIPVYVSHNPAGTSSQNFAHFGQHYDYGIIGNWKHYSQICPPVYHPENLMVKTAFFWGGQDDLADPTDVQNYLQTLPNDVILDSVNIPHYAHLDFIWAVDAPHWVYNRILELMKDN